MRLYVNINKNKYTKTTGNAYMCKGKRVSG